MKKIISILFLIFILSACMGGGASGGGSIDSGGTIDPGGSKDEETAPINVSIVSAPPEQKSPTTVDLQFIATQQGYNSADFLYKYELKTTAGSEVIAKEDAVSYTKVKFPDLLPSTQYSFQVWGINKLTGNVSLNSGVHVFTTLSDADKKMDLEINNISFNKMQVRVSEEIEVSFTLTNRGDITHNFLPNISFGSWNDYFEKTAAEEIWEIDPDERNTYKVIYRLREAKPSADNTVEKVFVSPTIDDLNSGENIVFAELATKEIDVILDENAGIELKEVYLSNRTVSPGESDIRIRYDIKNPNTDEYLYIKDIQPNFYTEDGVDVSAEWVDSKSEEKRINPGAQMVITRTYTLSNNATKGKIFLDAKIIGEIAGVEVIDQHAEKLGVVEVKDPSLAKLEAWIAYPEGAQDGIVSARQNFTIYYRINYDGDVSFYDNGEVTIDYGDIDGATLLKGNRTETIDLNKRKEWEIRMPAIKITGNIKIKISRNPTYRIGDGEFDVKFENTTVEIPIQVLDQPELEFEVGYENEEYGGIDGVIDASSEFEVYAKITNKNLNNLVTGNTKIAINLDAIEGMKLADGEILEKTVAVDEKVTWKLVAPANNKNGSIKFINNGIVRDPNSEEIYELGEQSLRATIKLGGELTLKRIYVDWETVEPGQSGIPIKFEVRNNGDADVLITEVGAVFSQKGEDVSDRWILSETTIREDTLLTSLASERTVIAYYKLKENEGTADDIIGNVDITGYAKGIELISGQALSDLEPTYDENILVKDIIPPVAVINVDKTTAKVGEFIFFDASQSTDNDKIVNYAWDFNVGDGILQSVREEQTYYKYDEPGEYVVSLQINDEEGNGPVTETIKIVIEEADEEPVEEDPVDAVAEISYQNEPENGTMLVGVDGSGSSPQNLTYIWTFRDVYGNQISSRPGQSTSIEFPIDGNYNSGDTVGTAILTVTDNKGKSATSDTLFIKIP